MPISSRLVPRRTTLAAAPLLAVAGCRWGPDEKGADTPEPEATPTVPDADQVDSAVAALTEANDLVAAVSTRHVELAKPLAALSALHTAHLDLLRPDRTSEPSSTPKVPRARRAALAAVRRHESTLQETLVGLSVDVSSGALARTLAAMAAGVAQHRRVLPTPQGGNP